MPSARGGRKHETPQGAGKPWGEDYSKGCCEPQVLETAPPRGHAWQRARGCTKCLRTCPEHVNVVVQDRTVQNMTWQALGRSPLMSCQPAGITASSALPWGEIYIAGRRLCDRRAPHQCCWAARGCQGLCCLPAHSGHALPSLLTLHLHPPAPSPAYCVASLPSARRGSFSPSSSLAKLFVQPHLLLFPHLVLA